MAIQPLHIVLVDHPDSGTDGANLTAIAQSISISLEIDFCPIYQLAVTCGVATGEIQPGDFPIGMFGDPDDPGALGYHAKGFGKVFPKLDKQDGVDLSSTIDHEVKETAKDFLCDLARMGMDGRFWADEPCDAVEQDTYERDGNKLSNFVLPAWYSGDGAKYDFMGRLAAPLTVGPGGYAQWFDSSSSGGWQQIVHDQVAPRAYRELMNRYVTGHGRRARRVHKYMRQRNLIA